MIIPDKLQNAYATYMRAFWRDSTLLTVTDRTWLKNVVIFTTE
jgi:hypothetical protein